MWQHERMELRSHKIDQNMTTHVSGGPLAGIQVLDLTSIISGPFAGQLLAELGADVVKIESPEGDTQRRIGPVLHDGMGPVYMNSNRGKRSIAIDLKKRQGCQVLYKLVRGADVLLYNMRYRAMHRLGLSYEILSDLNPRLIYAGIFGFGQDGPYADRPAYDDLIQAAAGLADFMRQKSSGEPQYVPLAIADRIAGFHAALAIAAALTERARSGCGQRLDIPMFENVVSLVLADHLGGRSFEPALDRGGYARLLIASRKPFTTKDGHVSVMPFTDEQWRRLYVITDRSEQFECDQRLRSMEMRSRHIDALYAELADILRSRTTDEWLQRFEEADIPAMPVHNLQSLFDDPHLKAIGFFQAEAHPSEGPLNRMRYANHWSRTPPAPSRPAPRLGEHGFEVLREAGFGANEIADLIEQGALFGIDRSAAE